MLYAYLRAPAVSVKTRIQVHLERHWQDNRGREVWWGVVTWRGRLLVAFVDRYLHRSASIQRHKINRRDRSEPWRNQQWQAHLQQVI